MERFKAFEDAAIMARLERLDRAETILQQTMAKRISQVEAEGRWLRSDPVFQQLSSALKRVRSDMRETEEELMRRDGVAAPKETPDQLSAGIADVKDARRPTWENSYMRGRRVSSPAGGA